MTNEMLPHRRFSREERERRWGVIRRLRDAENLVAMVTPANTLSINWGDTCVVTPNGGQRVGRSEPAMWVAK